MPRFFQCLCVEKLAPFLPDQYNLNYLGKGLTRDHFHQVFFQIGPEVLNKKIFSKNSTLEHKSFQREPHKNHSNDAWWNFTKWFRKYCFKQNADWQCTSTMTPYDQISSPWTCGSQWAKIRGIPWTNTHNMAAAYLFIQSSSFYVNYLFTLFLLVSSADNLCKQLGPRSGLTKCQAWSGSKLFDTLIVFQKNFFQKKNDFEKKKQQTTKMHAKLPSRQRFQDACN